MLIAEHLENAEKCKATAELPITPPLISIHF